MHRRLRSVLAPVAALAAASVVWWGIEALAQVPDPALTVAAAAMADAVGGGSEARPAEDSPAHAIPSGPQGPVTAPSLGAGTPEPGITVTPAHAAWDPSDAQWTSALREASALPLDQAAGQVIVAALSTPDADAAAALVSSEHLGGVILMGGAVTDEAGVRTLTAAVSRAGGDHDWGTMIGVDEEGGIVSRLAGVVPTAPGFMAAGATDDDAVVTAAYASQGAALADLGLTMDFAPVADVTIGTADPIIRSRSAGDDIARVDATVDAAVDGYLDGGIVPVVKHFPGHGSVTTDSHTALPTQAASLASLEDRDIAPFAAAVDDGAPAVMVGHIAVDAWGGEPASLDPDAYAYLRDDLGFTGLAITDALDMGAVAREPGEAAVAALAAGADVLLMPPDPAAARKAIVAAVDDGTVSRARLDQAVARIVVAGRWQQSLAADGTGDADAAGATARDLAVAGATVASRECEGPLVGDTVTLSGASEADRDRLAAALEKRGVTVGDGGTTVRLLGSDTATGRADVVVALAGPWGLARSTADSYVGLYGRAAPAMNALADILVGRAHGAGTWPVSVDVPAPLCAR